MIYIYTNVCTFKYVYVYGRMHIYTCTYVYVNVCARVCICIHTNMHKYTCTYVYINVCTHTHALSQLKQTHNTDTSGASRHTLLAMKKKRKIKKKREYKNYTKETWHAGDAGKKNWHEEEPHDTRHAADENCVRGCQLLLLEQFRRPKLGRLYIRMSICFGVPKKKSCNSNKENSPKLGRLEILVLFFPAIFT